MYNCCWIEAEAQGGLVRAAPRHYGAELKHIYGDSNFDALVCLLLSDCAPQRCLLLCLSLFASLKASQALPSVTFFHQRSRSSFAVSQDAHDYERFRSPHHNIQLS